jgi:pilus assembly protein CpaC
MRPFMTKSPNNLRRTAMGLVIAALIAGPALAQESAPAKDESLVIHIASNAKAAPQHLSLSRSKGIVLETDRDVREVFAANPAIVDVVVHAPRRIYVMGLGAGQTNLIMLDAEGKQIASVDIDVAVDVATLNEKIARELPGTRVKALAVNDSIVLSGSVNSVQEASRAQDMAQQFIGPTGKEKLVNGISIEARQQVLIQVRVTEMNRAISKQLGINAVTSVNVAGTPIAVATDNQFSLLGRAISDISGAVVGQTCVPMPCAAPNNVSAQLRALERIGLVHTLAEPNLTAVSGEAAKFLAGGEFPVPVGRDRDGNITVEYKPFGIGLAFTPVVLGEGRISLQISTEVSELTNTGALTLAGVTLPGLAVRRAQTTVELPSGGSLAIGGLIQQQTKQNLDALPGAKDLPVLGALFRSRDFQNNESELVVTVNAYLVNPVSPLQIARPDDGYVVPTDLETILLGRLNAVYGTDGSKGASKDAKGPAEAPKGAVGYIVQ